MRSKDGRSLMLDCSCGCDNGLRIRVDRQDDDSYFILSYTSGNFYREQKTGMFAALGKKIKKIWYIIRGKDYCYSEICMSRDDFPEFKEFLSSIA